MTSILNTKVLLSAGVIVAVAAALLGTTYAAWSTSGSIAGNTVGAAQLSMTVTPEGKSDPLAVPLPFSVSNMLPGMTTSPEERAVIKNTSNVPLELYMYVEGAGGAACAATKIAWQASHPGNAPFAGYTTIPTTPGNVDGAGTPATSNNFRLVYSGSYLNFWGIGNKVLIAPASEFGPNQEVALRQVVGFANDADNSLQGTGCQWTLYFVAQTV